MEKELVINVCGDETRAALLENGQLAEIFIERNSRAGMVGTIYKGKVKKILPGMNSAFVDIGLEKDSFLYVNDVDPRFENVDFMVDDVFDGPNGQNGKRPDISYGHKKIDDLLQVGQEILVQIVREPIGTKGARVTTHLSIPGRYLVLMPTVSHIGVSRKIKSFNERKRLKTIVTDLKLNGMGAIIRTASEGKNAKDLKKDVQIHLKQWKTIKKASDKNPAPYLVYQDENLTIRLLRDLLDENFKALYIDDDKERKLLKNFLADFNPEYKKILKEYNQEEPIFEHFGIEEKLQKLYRNKVWLKSGGHLVINQTEALVAIDVNTGKFVGSSNLEDTIFKLNLEAIEEVVRQIRLRDLGGILVIDFIDMESRSNRKKIINAFFREMRKDRGLYKILPINEFGLLQLTRKRLKSSLLKTLSSPCPYCDGMGYIKSHQSICYEIMREIIKLKPHLGGKQLLVRAHPEIVEMLRTQERQIITNLEKMMRKKIQMKEDSGLHHENFDIMSL